MMDGVVRLLQLTTEHIARIFLKEMKKLSQPQVNNLLALELISWKKIAPFLSRNNLSFAYFIHFS